MRGLWYATSFVYIYAPDEKTNLARTCTATGIRVWP
jgi:hypothetical protein